MTSIFPARRFLVNGSSSNLAVNGSVTPVEFILQPAAGSLFACYQLIFAAHGTGNINDPAQFWTFPALTIGISSEIKMNGTTVQAVGIIKTNFDLIQYIGSDFLGKTLGAHNLVRGEFSIDPQLTLNGNRGDYFKIIINDNLTQNAGAIVNMTISLRGSTIIF